MSDERDRLNQVKICNQYERWRAQPEMPRFYFHLYNDVEAQDEEGQQFADLDAARRYAQKLVRFEAAEAVKASSHFVQHHHIDIADEQGKILDTVRFGEVVKVQP